MAVPRAVPRARPLQRCADESHDECDSGGSRGPTGFDFNAKPLHKLSQRERGFVSLDIAVS